MASMEARSVGDVTGPVSSRSPSPPSARMAAKRPSMAPRNASQDEMRLRYSTAWERSGS